MSESVLADKAASEAAEPGTKPTALFGGRVPLARLRDLALVPAIVVIAVVGQIVSPVFLQADNLINVLQTMSEIALLVLAQTMILIVKKMDLSLESTMGLAPGWPPGWWCRPGRDTASVSSRAPGRFPSPSPSAHSSVSSTPS